MAEIKRVKRIAIAQPACRMVIIEVYSDDGKTEHTLHPVVAIRTTAVHVYWRPGDGYDAGHAGDRELRRDGWRFSDEVISDDPLFLDPETATLTTPREKEDEVSNVALWAAACAWPAEEDEQRLASRITDLTAIAVHRERRARERIEKAFPPSTVAG